MAAPVAPVMAQPVDPYAPLDGEPAPPAVGERDLEISEAVAAALVVRARELIAANAWADAQQLLGEALIESPDGAAAKEARTLLDEVNRHLGITTDVPDGPGIGDPIGDPIVDPYADQQYDPELPTVPGDQPRGGKRFMWHAAVMGGFIGGFIGDAASADLTEDGIDDETSGPIVGGVLIGALAGLAVGAGMRKTPWLTRDDVVTIDSFAAMGLVGSLSLAALFQPIESEAYSVNGVFGVAGGAITGLILAKRHDYSSRRMTRVDLWAASGAAVPWLIFAAASGDSDDAQAAGFFSMAGMIGGAWLGFRQTRKWDEPKATTTFPDAPAGIVQRDFDGTWRAGSGLLSVRPSHLPALGPSLGKSAVIDVVGVRF